ncbi:MAG: S8 family serine peptidase, partial [Chloroflexota bacterium]|nr:S8 family serine peptidase [Chloroflexota bacterium]
MKTRSLRTALSSLVCLTLLATFSTSGAQPPASPVPPIYPQPLRWSSPSNMEPATQVEGPRIRLAAGEFDPLADPDPAHLSGDLRLSAYPGDGTGYYMVQFQGPIATADVDALTAAGVQVFDYIPDFTFVVKMDNAARTTVEKMRQVRWVGLYQPAYRLPSDLLARAFDDVPLSDLDQPGDGRQIADPKALWGDSPAEVIVTVFRGEELAPIVAQIKGLGGVILDQSQTEWKSKLQVSIPPSHLTDLAGIPGVRWIEEAPRWELANDESADIMGVREVWDTHGLYGNGQTIAVCDTGLDQGSTSPASLHDDFENGSGTSRVVQIHELAGDAAPSDVNSGHGTHVAGSVLGNGDLSGATPSTHTYPDTAYVGMAPEASLVFQAVEDNSTEALSGIPLDLNTLFAQAAGSGATLHTNSWGSSVMGMYTSSSEDVDEYVWDHKDFTILFAASNDGIDSNSDGVVDLYSLGSPASAKNCVTVGATENDRPGIANTWGGGWPTDYPVDPINSDYMADDPSGLAAFSSRGPALDGRYKPDIVAPGSFIASVRSSLASGTGWGTIDTNYMYMGGTSMATPLAAGAATLVRQYYTDEESITPSAALIKATMVNGATDIDPGQYGTGATREIPGARPTNVAGWGRVDLENSIFPSSPRTMLYEDETTGLTTGASNTYTYTVTSSAQPFRVTLAWSDYPGSPAAAGGLVNDLDLMISGPGGPYYPNNANQRGSSQHLSYDDGVDNGGYHWSAGVRVAVRFTPASYPATLQTGLFLVGSNSSTYPKTFNWYVYDGNDATGPGTVLASGSTTIRRIGWHAVDLSGAGVVIPSGDFFLAIELPDDDLVWLYDTNAPVDERSWDYDGSWSKYTTEDYMFNAIVKSADASTDQDRVNNLVGIDVASPATGDYVVTVSGYNVPQSPQPYALVASGAITVPAVQEGPTVAGIAPPTGVNTGTVSVSVTGDNFQSGATVKLTKSGESDIPGTGVTVVNSNTVTCDLDLAGAATGAWNVVVTNPDLQSGTLSNGFTVVSSPTAPTVTSIEPSSGVNTGTVHITNLAGTNFQSGATVKLAKSGESDIPGSGVTVLNSNTIVCGLDLTGAATGAWDVVVTNPDLQSSTLPNGFTVNAPSDDHFVYLPLVLQCWPLLPNLQPISNADGDGLYTVSWTMPSCGGTPSSYEYQVDISPQFTSPQGDTTSNTSVEVYTPTPATYYWRVRAYISGQWTGWSNVRSVTVGSFSYVFVDNDTGGNLTIQIVGIETRSFAAGFDDYWRSVPVGTYNINVTARCGSMSDSVYFPLGDFELRYWCGYQALSTSTELTSEFEGQGEFPIVVKVPD